MRLDLMSHLDPMANNDAVARWRLLLALDATADEGGRAVALVSTVDVRPDLRPLPGFQLIVLG